MTGITRRQAIENSVIGVAGLAFLGATGAADDGVRRSGGRVKASGTEADLLDDIVENVRLQARYTAGPKRGAEELDFEVCPAKVQIIGLTEESAQFPPEEAGAKAVITYLGVNDGQLAVRDSHDVAVSKGLVYPDDGQAKTLWRRVEEPSGFTYLVSNPGDPNFLRLLFLNATDREGAPTDVGLNNLERSVPGARYLQRVHAARQVGLSSSYPLHQTLPGDGFLWDRVLSQTIGIDGGTHQKLTVRSRAGPMRSDDEPAVLYLHGYRVQPNARGEEGLGLAELCIVARLEPGPTDSLAKDQARVTVIHRAGYETKIWFGGINPATGLKERLTGVDNTGRPDTSETVLDLPRLFGIAQGVDGLLRPDDDYVAPRFGPCYGRG